jgi:hypothetical protein
MALRKERGIYARREGLQYNSTVIGRRAGGFSNFDFRFSISRIAGRALPENLAAIAGKQDKIYPPDAAHGALIENRNSKIPTPPALQ